MRLNMKKTITFSVLIITTLSIISKLLGFLRETVVAYYFGTTHEADIFFLVFGLFTFITSAVGISLGVSFLPVFIKERSQRGDLYANQLAFRFITQLFFLFAYFFRRCSSDDNTFVFCKRHRKSFGLY